VVACAGPRSEIHIDRTTSLHTIDSFKHEAGESVELAAGSGHHLINHPARIAGGERTGCVGEASRVRNEDIERVRVVLPGLGPSWNRGRISVEASQHAILLIEENRVEGVDEPYEAVGTEVIEVG
jgi:hypothetical protein